MYVCMCYVSFTMRNSLLRIIDALLFVSGLFSFFSFFLSLSVYK